MSAVYDYLVIGGGSGGIASARRAAKLYNAKVALIESNRLGGTCVNVGCVPKKVSYNAAWISECLKYAKSYGFTVNSSFNWKFFKDVRDGYVKRLNGIYENNLKKDGVEEISGHARFISKDKVEVISNEGKRRIVEAKHILIATGSYGKIPNVKGKEFLLTSDGFFDLQELPKKVLIVGAGYIAVELSGILNALGCNVTVAMRHECPLRNFDETISKTLCEEMAASGIKFIKDAELDSVLLKSIKPEGMGLHEYLTARVNSVDLNVTFKAESNDAKAPQDDAFNLVLVAIGRDPKTQGLNLEAAGVEADPKSGLIKTDKYQNTNVPNVYAVGDVCGPLALTPVAIAAGRRLSDRLFGNKDACLDYENVPTVVFSHPPIGAVGLTEAEARKKHGKVKIYQSKFVNMFFATMEKKQSTVFKVICDENDKVLGIHLIGMGSDEIMQGFGVALKMGMTKNDLDSCVAIHPTAAEELVTVV